MTESQARASSQVYTVSPTEEHQLEFDFNKLQTENRKLKDTLTEKDAQIDNLLNIQEQQNGQQNPESQQIVQDNSWLHDRAMIFEKD